MSTRFNDISERLIADRGTRWALFVVSVLIVLSVFGGCIANEKPVYCKIEGVSYWPIFQTSMSKLGLARTPAVIRNADWQSLKYDRVAFAPVAYSAQTIDLSHANFEQPFIKSDQRGWKYRHWLGTDNLGRDTLAGLIHGCRIAVLVGLCAMLLAALIGIPLGAFSGYYGNDGRRIPISDLVMKLLTGALVCYYVLRGCMLWGTLGMTRAVAIHFIMALVLVITGVVLRRWMRHKWSEQRTVRVPWDTIVMRGVEVLRSIPAFFLLFAVLGVIRSPSIVYVVLLIALLHAPTVIRYVRAEALKLRQQTFIDAARAIGLSDGQVIRRHIIPNALGPVFISIAFGIGGAVLLESGLSFLGIGLSLEEVSWGKMLNTARSNFSAWWMAIFPGLAIFLVIGVFNKIGDTLTRFFEEG